MNKIIKKIIPKKLLNLRHLFWAWYGAAKYDYPSEELLVIGVTGTSGKSSVIHFLRQILEASGHKVGSLSTVDFYIAGETKLNDKKMTMLGKMQIQKYLREMVKAGCDVALVETTSEGFLQYRHRFINYDTMILTGLHPEHLESHGGFENYKKAKLGIFEYVSKCKRKNIKNKKIEKVAIVNSNCEYANEFLQYNFDKKILFGLEKSDYSIDENGLHFKTGGVNLNAPLYGEYNIFNLLAVISVMRNLDVSWSVIQKAVENLKPAPGRNEFVKEAEEKGFRVLIDFAFEPVALQELYKVVKLLKPNKIIHVCGSTGGGRDKSRRGPIGKIVGENADFMIVTNEDPYDEDPIEIIKQVSSGAKEVGKILDKNLFEILDRREGIQKALEIANRGDLVLITGKGSEQAMCVKGGMIPWDDRQVVKEILQEL